MHLHGKKVIYTPGKFGSLGGRGRANSWKKSIKHQGKYLAAYIQPNGMQGSVEESVTPTPPSVHCFNRETLSSKARCTSGGIVVYIR